MLLTVQFLGNDGGSSPIKGHAMMMQTAPAANGHDVTLAVSTIDGIDKVPTIRPNYRQRLKKLYAPTREHVLAQKVFYILQIMSACFLQFSHGSNDTG
jgi:phosphate/sulfate permease